MDMSINPESIIAKLVKERHQKEEATQRIIENEVEWQKAANSLFGSPNGKLFIKYLLRSIGLFAVDNTRDPAKLLEDKGKRQIYLQLIRPYLTPELLMELENQR